MKKRREYKNNNKTEQISYKRIFLKSNK